MKTKKVTLNELEIVEACYQYLLGQGYKMKGICAIVVTKPKTDSLGRQRRGKIKFVGTLTNDPA